MLDWEMGRWLPLLTDAAAKSAVVLSLTWALIACLRRAPAATRHLALLSGIAVLLGLPLLMPLVPRQSLPGTAPLLSKAPAPPAQSNAAPVPVIPVAAPATTGQAAETPAVPLSPSITLPPPVLRKPPRLSPLPRAWAAWVVCTWLAGVLLCALRFLAAQARIGRLMRHCPPLSGDWGTKPEAAPFFRLKSTPTGTPPMVWGWPRPTLLLPSDAAHWPEARLRAVILHEAAHVRRQDWLTQTLTQAACALYWFNPLVWLTASRMQAEAERACDDAVLLSGIPPADYAQDLLAVARSLTVSQRTSFGAVTMARHSPVRNRLEAILDPARPRRRITRWAVGLALTVALGVAVPLAALRPAARAAAPAAVKLGLAAPTVGVPTEADIAKVQRHLQILEREQNVYDAAAAQPNMLTAAQTAEVDQWLQEMELKREWEQFDARMAAEHKQLRAEAKKPHTKQERQRIWGCIFAYEHPPQVVIQRQRAETQWFARMNAKIKALDEYQVVRETRIYAFDKKIALDRTRIEAMQMERDLGYSLHLSEDDITSMRDLGFYGEKAGQGSRADAVHVYLLFSKLQQRKRLDDADIDWLIASLRKPSKTPSVFRTNVLALFRRQPDASPVQQQKIREAVTPFLTSPDKWERKSAEQVLKKLGGNTPSAQSSQKAQAAPSAAPLPTPRQPKLTGISPMTPPKNIKTTLLKTAAFATLAAGLTLPALSAPSVPAPKPAVPRPTVSPTDALHWKKIVLQRSTVGTNPALTRWSRGDALPEGVTRIFFLTKDNAILVQATPAGLAQMQAIIKQIDAAPSQGLPNTLPTSQALTTNKLFLQNVVPATVLSLLHWNQGGVLPEGVTQISPLPKENALLVVATPSGYSKTRELVKMADVAPRQVQIKTALASVSAADLDALGVNFNRIPNSGRLGTAATNNPAAMLIYLDGNIAAQILETFTKKGSVIQSPIITTTNNVEASMSVTGDHSTAAWSNLDTSKLTVTPRVNSDNSVTLKLHSAVSYVSADKMDKETQVNTSQEVNTLRTLRSGDTLVLGAPSPQFNGKSDRYLLLFVTATILPDHNSGAVTVH